MINIYGHQESAAKSSLWNHLAEFMNQHNGKFILFGDFNTFLHEYERSGSLFSRIEAEHFNAFIDSTCLIDLSIRGRHFTCINKAGTKLSKLDRFLISEGVMEDIPNIKVTAIERLWSDHSPILLHSKKADFGPSPFKLYNSWLSRDRFDDIVKSMWDSMETGNALDLIQKARIKWDIEGDENSKFFHEIINSKRRTQAIAGILHDGYWITKPPLIKDVFLNYYKDKFQAHDSQVIFTPIANSPILCHHDRDFLESHISLDEVKNAVWECGSNKAPGPDGLSFAFIKKYWDLTKMDIFEFINSFFASGSMPQGANSIFYAYPEDQTGCAAGCFSFTHLGLPIGANINLTSSWQILIDRFHKRLSSWKANLLSIGGRLILIKAVLGSLDSRNMAWVKWSQVLSSFEKGGLKIGSLKAFNLALLQKWRWRSDIGTRNTAYLNDLLLKISQIDISVDEDTCTWVLSNDGTFSVKCARRLIDSKFLPSIPTPTMRDKFLSRKVNIFLWRLSLDRLPHRLNLSSRGLDIPTISCSSCNGNVESADHVFFECDLVKEIWCLVRKWCDISIPTFASYDTWNSWFSTWQATIAKSRRLYIIFAALFWWIWRYRNSVTFSSDSIKKCDLFDNIRASSFSWISNMGHVPCNWVE
nr:RNA-directed DNA polymerase, eukaryota [Tanacetum cinerariifolium]